MPCRNLCLVAERLKEISQPQCGWIAEEKKTGPEGTQDLGVSDVLSGQHNYIFLTSHCVAG
jgi:hypothetical protein